MYLGSYVKYPLLLGFNSTLIFLDTFSKNTQISNLINPINAELNPICHLLTLLGDDHIIHVSRVRVKICAVVGTFFHVDGRRDRQI